MESLIVYPESKEQLTALKAVMKAMKIAFVQQEETIELPPRVMEGVKEALKQADNREGLLPFTSARDMLNQE
jgi:hypothetical protein